MRDTERERQIHRQREKQAPCRETDVGLDPESPGSLPEPKAITQLLSHPGIPMKAFYTSFYLPPKTLALQDQGCTLFIFGISLDYPIQYILQYAWHTVNSQYSLVKSRERRRREKGKEGGKREHAGWSE